MLFDVTCEYDHFIIVMFKKKIKRDQGVLNLNEDEPKIEKKIEQQEHNPTRDNQPHLSDKHTHHAHHQSQTQSDKSKNNHPKQTESQSQNTGEYTAQKRTKNNDHQYDDDAQQLLDNQPKKKVKELGIMSKPKGVISNSTVNQKQRLDQAVHQAFEDRNFKAGKSLIKDLEMPADQLEEQLAKKRFLQNVENTRLVKQGKLNSKIYRGLNAYANHKMTGDDIEKAEEAYKKKMGPSRLNSTIKNSCRFDYVLNLCKDWHDSGYCPFGNSCLYLHDRSNHKTGWQLEKDFEQAEKERWRRINNPEIAKKQDKEKLLKTIEQYKPELICTVCHQQFHKPVQVECGHIYCTHCAIKLLKCKECGKRLGGIMNSATDKLANKTKAYAEMVEKLENGEDQTLTKRRKFQDTDALDVFND